MNAVSKNIQNEIENDVVENWRKDFPILDQKVNGNDLVYLDNAATTQKPTAVIETISRYYSEINSNIHRGVHKLSQLATDEYEDTREKVRQFLNANSLSEIIFTRGTTEAINLIAESWGGSELQAGDEVIISAMEHHANIVPWQIICEKTGAKLNVIPMNDDGELLIDEYKKLINEKTKIVAVVHVSNALGTINPVKEIIEIARAHDALVLLDGAQAVAHMAIDVQELDCDFYVFSGHKLYGPTGIGVLYGKEKLLEKMPPYQSGGDMILTVSFEKTEYNDLPYKFEAGTPNIAGTIGLGSAIDYVSKIGFDAIATHENALLEYATEQLQSLPGFRTIGTAKQKASVLSFVIKGVHPHDLGTILDTEGIATRTGHHCAMPVMTYFGVPATARASFALYNTKAEVDVLKNGLIKTMEIMGV
ncbi:MAG: SufS family cysteine desulfurase [Gammaproteobacteria bacterium]